MMQAEAIEIKNPPYANIYTEDFCIFKPLVYGRVPFGIEVYLLACYIGVFAAEEGNTGFHQEKKNQRDAH